MFDSWHNFLFFLSLNATWYTDSSDLQRWKLPCIKKAANTLGTQILSTDKNFDLKLIFEWNINLGSINLRSIFSLVDKIVATQSVAANEANKILFFPFCSWKKYSLPYFSKKRYPFPTERISSLLHTTYYLFLKL